jgi:hypothetical protein
VGDRWELLLLSPPDKKVLATTISHLSPEKPVLQLQPGKLHQSGLASVGDKGNGMNSFYSTYASDLSIEALHDPPLVQNDEGCLFFPVHHEVAGN